jgi:hypothetical protein
MNPPASSPTNYTEMAALTYTPVNMADDDGDVNNLTGVAIPSSTALAVLPQTDRVTLGDLAKLLLTIIVGAVLINLGIYLNSRFQQHHHELCDNAKIAFPVAISPLTSDGQRVVWEFRFDTSTFNCTTFGVPDEPVVYLNSPRKVFINDNRDVCCLVPQEWREVNTIWDVILVIVGVFSALADIVYLFIFTCNILAKCTC